MNKIILAAIGILIAFGFILFMWSVAAKNGAITLETQVQEQKSAIDIQLQRRGDLILALVDTVEASSDFEKDTLQKVIEARSQARTGNVEQASLSINAVVEAYPGIKSTEAYKQLMTEISVTENLIAQQRKTYNFTVSNYKKYVRVFPNNILLGGYRPIEAEYLEFDTPAYDTNLFK